ncbi:MAG: tRNA (N6-threonylcarbamoyladenosine(37)-N6)-methyltransferase TrmO [Clostridia bacterium]|nr:tRNA (N6-threonylcarbamoyladenosine(37)-N6)-methyltransferase TrmO [Clostridia bacterium]
MERTIKPIGVIHSDFKEKFGIPRQSGRSPSTISTIEFFGEYNSEVAFKKLEQFSHIWILFDFSLSHKEKPSLSVRPPRLGGNEKVGVFASRSPFRPNNIGLSCVKLLSINNENNSITLSVAGADILDGTPIYDIKPYIPSSDCILNASGGYSEKFTDYKLKVDFDDNLLSKIPREKRLSLIECLSEDPRPSYQNDQREYGMKFANFNIRFTVNQNVLKVIDVKEDC